MIPEKGNFFIKGKIFDQEKAEINNWVIIWEKNHEYCQQFERALFQAAQAIGIRMSRPKCVQFIKKPESLDKSISDLLKTVASSKPQIIVNLAEKNMQKFGYKPFKKICRENGLQSQQAIVDFKNLEKKGYFDSLMRQIIQKIGFRGWLV